MDSKSVTTDFVLKLLTRPSSQHRIVWVAGIALEHRLDPKLFEPLPRLLSPAAVYGDQLAEEPFARALRRGFDHVKRRHAGRLPQATRLRHEHQPGEPEQPAQQAD